MVASNPYRVLRRLPKDDDGIGRSFVGGGNFGGGGGGGGGELESHDLSATGLYSAVEAARLTGVPARTIRDWLTIRALWSPRVAPSGEHELFLDFLDLLEIRVVSGLRRKRVSLQKIRKGIFFIQSVSESTHPLISGRLFLEWRNRNRPSARLHVGDHEAAADRRPGVIDVQTGQLAWHEFLRLLDARSIEMPPERGTADTPGKRQIERMLDEGVINSVGVKYQENGSPYEWRPAEETSPEVVLDPLRAFGKPIVHRRGIPTAIIAQMNGVYTRHELEREMGLTGSEVEQALRFESELSPA